MEIAGMAGPCLLPWFAKEEISHDNIRHQRYKYANGLMCQWGSLTCRVRVCFRGLHRKKSAMTTSDTSDFNGLTCLSRPVLSGFLLVSPTFPLVCKIIHLITIEMKYLMLALAHLTFQSTVAQGKTFPNELVDEVATKLIKKGPIKSLSVGIVTKGESRIFHYGDSAKGDKATDSSYFELASVTKTFTGLLLAQAVLDRKINLDEDIRHYLEGDFPNLEFDRMFITPRQLATHMAGLPYTFPDKPELFNHPDYDVLPFILDSLERGFSKEDFFTALHQVSLTAKPGTQFKYSNVDANLLAYILEKVYAASYEDILESAIFRRTSMSHTKLSLAQKESAQLVQGYNTKGIKMPFVSASSRAAAALKSTMPDIMKYLAFHLDETNPLVKLDHQPMWSPDQGSYASGYYWQMDSVNNERKIFQNGGSFGTSCWLELYPDTQTGIFIVTNVSGPDIHARLSEIANKIYKACRKL